MDEQRKFNLLEGRSSAGPGRVYLFLTSGSWEVPSYAEAFLLIAKDTPERRYREKRFTFARGSVEQADAEEMLRKCMMTWVDGELEEYLCRWQQTQGVGTSHPLPYEFSELAPDAQRLWLRTAFEEAVLRRIQQATGCEQLKRYIVKALNLEQVLEEQFKQ
jgi:hypothetical protein